MLVFNVCVKKFIDKISIFPIIMFKFFNFYHVKKQNKTNSS